MSVSIVFMGTPQFAVPILQALIDDEAYDVKAVVTQPDRRVGRKRELRATPVKELAVKYGIEVLQPEKLSGSPEMQRVIDLAPDFEITAAFGQFLPVKMLEAAKIAAINVHGSLLPKYRGGAPIQYSIINGDQETGVTIMYMVKAMDAGDIISQAKITIDDNMILDELYQKMSFLGRDLLLKTLPDIINGTCTRIKQNDTDATFGYNVKKEETKIDFTKNAIDIHNLIRGLNEVPGAFCYLDDKRLKIYEIEILEETSKGDFGKIIKVEKDGIIVTTKDKLIKIKDIAIEGKKRCKVKEYLNGIKKDELVGKVLK